MCLYFNHCEVFVDLIFFNEALNFSFQKFVEFKKKTHSIFFFFFQKFFVHSTKEPKKKLKKMSVKKGKKRKKEESVRKKICKMQRYCFLCVIQMLKQ